MSIKKSQELWQQHVSVRQDSTNRFDIPTNENKPVEWMKERNGNLRFKQSNFQEDLPTALHACCLPWHVNLVIYWTLCFGPLIFGGVVAIYLLSFNLIAFISLISNFTFHSKIEQEAQAEAIKFQNKKALQLPQTANWLFTPLVLIIGLILIANTHGRNKIVQCRRQWSRQICWHTW